MNHHHNNYLKGCGPNFTEQAIRKVFWNASIMINERLTFYQDNSLSKQTIYSCATYYVDGHVGDVSVHKQHLEFQSKQYCSQIQYN